MSTEAMATAMSHASPAPHLLGFVFIVVPP
jgi:hypothetical protein